MMPPDEPKEEVAIGQTPTEPGKADQAAELKGMPKAEEQPSIESGPVEEAVVDQMPTPTAPGTADQTAELKGAPKAEEQPSLNSVPAEEAAGEQKPTESDTTTQATEHTGDRPRGEEWPQNPPVMIGNLRILVSIVEGRT